MSLIKRRFARPVGAEDGDVFALGDGEGDVVQDEVVAALDADVVEFDQREHVNRASASALDCAAPESMETAAILTPSRKPAAAPAATSAAEAFTSTMSRRGPGAPARTRWAMSRLASASPPFRSAGCAWGTPKSSGPRVSFRPAAPADLPGGGGAGGGDFVEAVGAVHDEAALQTEGDQRVRHQFRRVLRGGAHQLRAGAGRIGQRTQQIEDRPHLEIDPHRLRVLHGGVHGGGEQEADAHLADRPRGLLRRDRDSDAQRLQQVGAAAAGWRSSDCRAWRRARPRPPRRTPRRSRY